MTTEQWARVTALFEEACACPQAERECWLASRCDDAVVRGEVEAMLRAYATNPDFMEEPGSQVRRDVESLLSAHAREGVGSRIGAYDLVAELGRGGMGEVFAAVRADGHYDQKVALKLVRAGHATDGVVERFRAERQILAGLEHPNIARLVDGGATEGGTPYLVMELVDGVPIDAFCDTRGLSIAERLRLFLHVCAAVQYAHQRLVIHRDIKPANILVTGDGTPKLLDFGIAKVLDPAGNTEETMLRPFTPEYASPEQVRGEPVSTATDVYALGMVLYRLLTGRSPYHVATRTPRDLADAVTSKEPERPSAARRELRGDLDVILLKALRKEPDRRYSSAEQFAEDIRRHLEGLPVAARKGTVGYRAGKFARRHRTMVAAATLVLVTLIAGIVVTVRQSRIAEDHRRRAEARFNDVRKLANSLIFEVHDSIRDLPGATGARRVILQRSLEYLDSLARESDNNEPDLQRELATAYSRIGVVQGSPGSMNLGDEKAAAVSLQKAIHIRESLARAHPDNRADQVELASAYLDYGTYEAKAASVATGYEYVQRGLAILDRERPSAPNDLRILNLSVRALRDLGEFQVGEGLSGSVGSPAEGLVSLQKASQLAARAIELAPSDPLLAAQQAGVEIVLGDAFLKLGDRPQTFPHYQRGLDLLAPLAERGDNLLAAYNTAVVNSKIGDVWLIEGKTAQALPYYEESLRRSVRMSAADSSNQGVRQQEAISLVALGHALLELGRADDGIRYAQRALARLDPARRTTASDRAVEVLIRGWLGEALERQGRIREASHEYALSQQVMGALLAGGVNDRRVHGFWAAATVRLAATLVRLGDIDKATQEYGKARNLLEPVVRANPGDHEIAYVLAETYTAEGNMAAVRARGARTPADRLEGWTTASSWFRKSLSTWKTVPNPARISTSGFEVMVPAEVSRRLAECDRAVIALGGAPAVQP